MTRAETEAGTFAALSQLAGLAGAGPKFLYLWLP